MNKLLRILVIISLASLLVVMSAGCSGPALVSITASPAKVNLDVNATQQLSVTAKYVDGNIKEITTKSSYVSNDKGVATVTTDGLITGIAAGSATVTVFYGEREVYKFKVSVTVN